MINMNNILAALIFLALVVAPPVLGGVRTHSLTVEERLERIEHINVTAEKKIKKDRYADKEVMAALEEVRKIRKAGAPKEEVMEALKEVRKIRRAKGKGMKHKQRRHSHPHSHKGRPHKHGPR